MSKMSRRDLEILRNIQTGRNWRATMQPDGSFSVPTTMRGPKSQAVDRLVKQGYVSRDPMRRPALKLTPAGEAYADELENPTRRKRPGKYET